MKIWILSIEYLYHLLLPAGEKFHHNISDDLFYHQSQFSLCARFDTNAWSLRLENVRHVLLLISIMGRWLLQKLYTRDWQISTNPGLLLNIQKFWCIFNWYSDIFRHILMDQSYQIHISQFDLNFSHLKKWITIQRRRESWIEQPLLFSTDDLQDWILPIL